MADIAGIWNLQCLGFARRDEVEGMTAHFLVRDRFGDLRHVTADALVACATGLMMGMRLDRGGVRPGLRVRTMAVETERVAGLAHHRDVFITMRIVATETGDAARIHQALGEIVTLHPVLVRGAVRKLGEGEVAELVVFALPVVLEVCADVKANRPIVILAVDRVRERLALRVALDAGVAGVDIVEAPRVENGVANRLFDMRLAWAVTSLAADIPLGDGLGVDVVIHGMRRRAVPWAAGNCPTDTGAPTNRRHWGRNTCSIFYGRHPIGQATGNNRRRPS